MKTLFILAAVMILWHAAPVSATGQNLTQTIKGRVTDVDSRTPLPGATVYLSDVDPPVGTITDENGDFRFEDVVTGRRTLCISYVGYETLCLDNLNLTTGKQLVLDLEIRESPTSLDEVVVHAREQKGSATNSMSMISSRTFSVEESQRFAGARNDVARMALNYAGVSAGNDATNEIIIRGNSPNGLLWQLEGVEISNPNHFGFAGATGGPVGILNNNNLANSDFLTSAFSPEYGNALSGVFDLRMREGNTEKAEFLGQIGFNGFEVGAEGPISKKFNSSYMINYRYSTLGFFKLLGINFGTGVAVPEYQDINFKFATRLGRGRLTLFGFAGNSSIELLATEQDSSDADNFYANPGLNIYNNNRQGVAGLKYFRQLGERSYGELLISADALENQAIIDTVVEGGERTPLYQERSFNIQNYSVKGTLGHKFNSRLNMRAGAEYRIIRFALTDSIYLNRYNSFFNRYDDAGTTGLGRAYVTGNVNLSRQLTLTGGLHSMWLTLNDEISLEPRLALQYSPAPRHTFTAGYGRHSKMLPMFVYYRRIDLDAARFTQPNKELGMQYANHYVLAWDWQITNITRIKVEGYYQQLENAVVEQHPSSFSMLNNNSFQFEIPDTLVNGGTGTNMGVEFTLEQFLKKGFYYLVTASIFDSKYEGSDGITRSTAFDGDYVFNALAGKEFPLPSRKDGVQRYFTADVKMTAAGGQKYTPLDLEASRDKGSAVYLNEQAYSEQFKDYFRLDIRVALRTDREKYSQEFAIDVQNVTNRENPLYMQYNVNTGEQEVINQLKLFPVAQYRIIF